MAYHDIPVADEGDLKDGEMRQVTAGDVEVLLARVGGRVHAVAAHCTHYGAPLADGVLCGERVVCPWHHACFNVATGDLEEPPALDALERYAVRVEGGKVVVRVPEGETSGHRVPPMARRDAADARTFVIVGGGAAGYAAAQTLREDGFTGRIALVTRERRRPYDRPNLSKDYLQGEAPPEWMPLRPDDFYDDYGIDVLEGREATVIDREARAVRFADGSSLPYDKVLVATGGTPRRLRTPGAERKNVFALRSFDDADAVVAAAEKAQRAVVVGASFIGMEVASSLRQRGLSVTVVAPDEVPFARVLGEEIGAMYRALHEAHGVAFRLGQTAEAFEGAGAVEAVVLGSGERLPADFVVVGIGVTPATDVLGDVAREKDGGVVADAHLRVAEDVYAAGDIVHVPDARTGERVRIEHWRYALQQGRVAAHNMAGRETAFDGVPFFWTQQFGTSLRYVGHARTWDEIVVDGDVAGRDFLAYYVADGQVRAVAGMKRDREMARLHEQMRRGELPSLDRLR